MKLAVGNNHIEFATIESTTLAGFLTLVKAWRDGARAAQIIDISVNFVPNQLSFNAPYCTVVRLSNAVKGTLDTAVNAALAALGVQYVLVGPVQYDQGGGVFEAIYTICNMGAAPFAPITYQALITFTAGVNFTN